MQKTQGENQLGVLAEQKGPCGDSRGSERWVRLGGEGVRLHALEPALPVQITATYRLRDLDAI